ncbi:hypothetical protein GWI33_010574 [Rhynchophorus ferrugineus]|uniref:Uncharacterized protein n=1 Tax=Rhynchophorus ferrugineus TaxID=354439 RepID=A0A834MJK6_RHYFE|nr:hypothetical protein GWI33_010574 [Rhynchophorus ferrugineus]
MAREAPAKKDSKKRSKKKKTRETSCNRNTTKKEPEVCLNNEDVCKGNSNDNQETSEEIKPVEDTEVSTVKIIELPDNYDTVYESKQK